MKAAIISILCSHEELERNGHGKKKLVTPKSLSLPISRSVQIGCAL